MTEPTKAGDGGFWCALCPTHGGTVAEIYEHAVGAHPGTSLANRGLAARLARVEQERDELASKLRTAKGERDTWMGQHTKTAQDLTNQRDGALDQWQKEREQHDLTRVELATEVQAHRDVQLRAMRADAELASARQELERLRAAQQWIVARDGGRWCERCEGEIRRGEAYEVQPGTGGLAEHVRCPEGGDSWSVKHTPEGDGR